MALLRRRRCRRRPLVPAGQTNPGEHHHHPGGCPEVETLVEHDDPQRHRDHRQQIADRRGVGGALRGDDPVGEVEGDPGGDDAQDHHSDQDLGADLDRCQTAGRQGKRGQAGRRDELRRGQRDGGDTPANQGAAHEREADGIARRCGDDGEGTPADRPGRLPRREDQHDPGEPEQESAQPGRREFTLGAADDADQQGPERRRRVQDTGHPGVDGLLADAEHGERQGVTEEGGHDDVTPGRPVPRQPSTGGEACDQQRGGAEDAPAEGDLDRCQRVQGQLDPEEGRSPQQGEHAYPQPGPGPAHDTPHLALLDQPSVNGAATDPEEQAKGSAHALSSAT